MKVDVRPIHGFTAVGNDGRAQVLAEVPSILWLIGLVHDDEAIVVSALDATLTPSKRWLDLIEASLPVGLEFIGVFVKHQQADGTVEVPKEVPLDWRCQLRFLTTRGQDGSLLAYDVQRNEKKLIGPCSLEASWPSCQKLIAVRGTLDLALFASSGKDLASQLTTVSGGLESSLRFRFPGSRQVPSLTQLKEGGVKVGPFSSTSASLDVEVLSDELDAFGRTNFVDFNSPPPLTIALDFVAYVAGSEALDIATALIQASRRQLDALAALAATKGSLTNGLEGFSYRCYSLDGLGHPICLTRTEEQAHRADLLRLFRLPLEPLLRPDASLARFGKARPQSTGKLINPHVECGMRPSWWKAGDSTRSAFVKGVYEYSHYMQDNFDDAGWGCAYRSLQTCVTWFRLQHYASKDVPSIPEIQRLLKRIDEAHKEIEIGSKQWLGTVEGMYLLQEYLQVDCKMMYCQDAADMASQAPQMLQHLEKEGTPIMMGAGMYAYTLVGLCFDPSTGDVAYLIVDPHYTGSDDLKPIISKGWVGWKNLDFFSKSTDGSFINCCLPLVPRGPEHV